MIATCPTPEELRCYLLGNYSDAEGSRFEQHLAECSACEEMLSEFDDSADVLLRHLPLAAGEVDDENAAGSGWLDRLKAGPPTPSVKDAAIAGTNGEAILQGLESYELTGVLGQGGMGVVYLGKHRELGRPVAIKVVNPRLMSAGEARRRFEREIKILGGLDHPGIVSATDAGKVGPAAFLVMQFIDGLDLARLVRQAGPLGIGEACEVARQMALALAAAHKAGAVHRDVKPSNVMIDRAGRVKLLDFGLADAIELAGKHGETSAGRLLGTLDYMAPEQAGGDPVGVAADLYGLGATLFFLLAARPPRPIDREQPLLEQLNRLAHQEAPRLSQLRPGVPQELCDFIARLLAREVQDRPNDAEEVATLLGQWADPGAMDALPEMIPVNGGHSGGDEALQSLFALLDSPTTSGVKLAPGKRSRTPRITWIAVLGGLAAALFFGIVLLVDTPEGTLRIESEAAGITVELLDESERVTTLEVDRGENTTELKAGNYRIRLAGDHDRLSVTPNTIELQQGSERLARITYVDAAQEQVATTDAADDAILFQGEPLRVWQRRFEAETDPMAKLQAAKALITIRGAGPEVLEQVMQIGSRLLDEAFGEKSPRFALENALNQTFIHAFKTMKYRFAPVRWSTSNYPELREEWDSLIGLVKSQLADLPPEQLARQLVDYVRDAPPAEASFAMRLVSLNQLRIFESQEATALVFDGLRRDDIPELNQAALLFRANNYDRASKEAQQKVFEEMKAAGKRLVEEGIDERDKWFIDAWLISASLLGLDPKLEAQVALERIVDTGEWPEHLQLLWDIGDHQSTFILPPDRSQWRMQTAPLFKELVPVVNNWLLLHGDDSPPATVAKVIDTLKYPLRRRQSWVEWNTEETAQILEAILEDRYGAEPIDPVLSPVGVSPDELMALIILCGGDLPPVPDESSLTEPVREQLAIFRHLMTSDPTLVQFNREKERLTHLTQEAPYHTVRIALEETEFPERLPFGAVTEHFNLHGFLTLAGSIDPLLLLAIATDLTGVNEQQDNRIALFMREAVGKNIRETLRSPFVVHQIAEKWLRRMRERAKSETLIAEIDKLLPQTSKNTKDTQDRYDPA